MADFGKLNFSTSFNPTSAFPLDARCYFDSLALAEAAAATAEEVGSTNTVYHYGMKLLVDDGTTSKWYTIQRDKTLLEDGIGGGSSGNPVYKPGDNIKIENGIISVLTADEVEQDNTRPITAAAVHTEIGNIEILLKTI